MAGHRAAARQRGEPHPFEPPHERGELLQHRHTRVARGEHRDGVEGVVGGQRGVDVAAAIAARKRSLAARIPARSAAVRSGTAVATASSCIAATTLLGVAGGAGVERADRGGAARGRDHQARLRQPQQRLAHGRAGDAEPLREVAVAELLARRERAVDDRVAQPHVERRRAADTRVATASPEGTGM